MKTQVYINWGRLVADCPCGDAREVKIGDTAMRCDGGHVNELVWADEIPRALAALEERTADRRRNWFPRDHPYAVRTGQPHGQSVRALREEAAAGEEADAQHLAEQRARILAEVRAANIPIDVVLAALKGA